FAAAAIEWTSRALVEASLAFLRQLPMSVRDEDAPACLFVHAEAATPHDWRYVHDTASAERSLAAVEERVTFCGHVHVPQLYNMGSKKQAHLFSPQAGVAIPLVGNRKWLAVMGATGQPRDRNPAAAYAIFDTDKYELTYFRVPYDIESAAAKIHAASLPQMLAARLFIGR
ncbi:MAG: metallophosphoesterase, partial [Beijerinckiaceae bacterium]